MGRVTPAGVVSIFTGTGIASPHGIAAGPDGTLWFTNLGNSSIGQITPDAVVSNFTGSRIDSPSEITTGPDGNVWFTNFANSSIGRITPDGVVSNFTSRGINGPDGMVAGPDGNLWFTNWGNNSIGRITPDGVVSNYTGTGINSPRDIAVGPDGNLWFTNAWNNSIGRITPDGVVSNHTGAGISGPRGITAGPDGSLWFTNRSNNSIGQAIGLDVPELPGAPTAVAAVPGNAQAIVGWAAPASDGGSPVTGYTVTADPGSATCGTTTELSCTVSGLTNGTSYTFTVVATNWVGDSPPSEPSDPVAPHATATTSECGVTEPGPFSDVPGDQAFCTQIEWMATTGISGGFPDGTFRPTVAVSRQAMAAFLHRFAGEPEVTLTQPYFDDVPTSQPFYTAIQWMAEVELSTGTPQTGSKPLYKPTDAVSRQAMAAFLHRIAGEPDVALGAPFFGDVSASHPFFEAIQWMAEVELSTGTAQPGGNPDYLPVNPVSRQAMAAFLQRFDENIDPPVG
ncbi:MAG: S-layer homology domain-containing protein [Acidimicrobiia bacterium]|nr:S-layer homology domain-containing protein [Acidimicrobiia bacterium]